MARLTPVPVRGGLPLPLLTFLGAAVGALATYALLQIWSAMATAEVPLLWWAGRALGFLAYAALTLSMLFGILVSSRGLGGRVPQKWLMDLHQEWTLAALIATVLHVVVLVTHAESRVTPWAAVIPFASSRLTGEVTLGTVGFLLLAVIAASSWVRSRVPFMLWRAIHALAFGAMVLAIAHSIAAGTDTDTAWAQALYLSTASLLGIVTALRVGIALVPARR